MDGGLQDLEVTRYATFEDLRGYCRLVAGAVGVACLPVYGGGDPELAETLGVALQLINIIRDVAEDWSLGRVYLPTDELEAFAVLEEDIGAGLLTPQLQALLAFQAERARVYLDDGLHLLDQLDRRSALCVGAFAGLYRATLERIEDVRVRRLRRAPAPLAARQAPHRRGRALAMRSVVIGGGLAGLAAALRLVEAGHEVTLLEARPTLGGVVQTLPKRDGDPSPPPDNGQHIGLGCFTAWQEFLGLAGSAGSLDRRPLELPVLDEQGRVGVISDRPLDLLRYRHLPLRDRLGIVRTLARLRRLDPAAHDGETFADVARLQGARDRALLGRLHPPGAELAERRGERRARALHGPDRAARGEGRRRPAAADGAARRRCTATRRGRRCSRAARR